MAQEIDVIIVGTVGALLALIGTGCASMPEHDRALRQYGEVYYLDGAGGGALLTNWGRGVKSGLRAGGYEGDFVNFTWQTGLGVIADQRASVEYKRSKARALAAEIRGYHVTHPGVPVHLVALSAGTAVAVFTLEALPENHPVDNLVLLGSSVSQHYDLTRALQRVRGRIYVFTSEKDAVLRFGVSTLGTADRQYCGACAAGLDGFHVPPNAHEQTRQLYGKIDNIAWRPEFAQYGNLGGHTDAVDARFVEHQVAPLLLGDGPRFLYAAPAPGDAGS